MGVCDSKKDIDKGRWLPLFRVVVGHRLNPLVFEGRWPPRCRLAARSRNRRFLLLYPCIDCGRCVYALQLGINYHFLS